ncbi:MAG TPA: hypothetical protein VHF51_13160 [Solirubrobacteraceae bacterium]|nr:hypothetical protein [Solirubrobacteraceae bacterium]
MVAGGADTNHASFATGEGAGAATAGHGRATEHGGDDHSAAPSLVARTLGAAGGIATGVLLGAISAARRAKAVHPHGESYVAELSVLGAATAPAGSLLLRTAGVHRAIVRFSRSLGLPRPLPDLLGMSIRVLDAYGSGRHQDFLLVSSADLPVLHHVFLPAADTQQRPYTSSLPYRSGGTLFVVGALPDERSPRPDGDDEFHRLRAAAATGQLRFQLAVASIMGTFRPVADIRIGAPLPATADALRFNPWNTGGGLEPAGVLNAMRRYAYPMSQWAWRQARRGATLQDTAERVVAAARTSR